ncbi:MAG: SxtJ family membrane protein [Candidatus Omnitrophota bacterium]
MKKTTKKDLRQFGIVLGIVLAAFGTIHFLKHHINAYKWFFSFSAGSLIFGIFFPEKLKPVFKVFIKIAHAIGWFNTRVILLIVYYFIVTPIGFLMKVFGKDILDIKIDRTAKSYWIMKNPVSSDKERLTKQF